MSSRAYGKPSNLGLELVVSLNREALPPRPAAKSGTCVAVCPAETCGTSDRRARGSRARSSRPSADRLALLASSSRGSCCWSCTFDCSFTCSRELQHLRDRADPSVSMLKPGADRSCPAAPRGSSRSWRSFSSIVAGAAGLLPQVQILRRPGAATSRRQGAAAEAALGCRGASSGVDRPGGPCEAGRSSMQTSIVGPCEGVDPNRREVVLPVMVLLWSSVRTRRRPWMPRSSASDAFINAPHRRAVNGALRMSPSQSGTTS